MLASNWARLVLPPSRRRLVKSNVNASRVGHEDVAMMESYLMLGGESRVIPRGMHYAVFLKTDDGRGRWEGTI